MIKGLLSFFKCCKSKPKPKEEEEDIEIINNREIQKILTDYNIEDKNFNTIGDDRASRGEKREIKGKISKKNNDSIITIETGNKMAVDEDSNRYKNEEIENLKSYQNEVNRSIEEAKLSYNNTSLIPDKSRNQTVLEIKEIDPNKILVPEKYIRDDEKEHIIFVIFN